MTTRHAAALLATATVCLLAATAALLTGAKTFPAEDASAETSRARYQRELAAAFVQAQCWQCHAVSTFQAELTRDFGVQPFQGAQAGPDLAGIGGLYGYDWHVAHLFNPQSVVAGSRMPAQRHLFVLEGEAKKPNRRGEAVPAISFRGQRVIEFLQTLNIASALRPSWPKGRHGLPSSGSVSEGRALFVRHCSGCHGAGAAGDGEAAVFFDRAPANLAAARMNWRTTRAPLPSYDDLFTTLTNGLPGSGMPSFAHLAEHERASLVAYMVALNRDLFELFEGKFAQNVLAQAPRADAALIERGRAAFADERNMCVRCHGDTGRGDGVERPELLRKYGVAPRDLRRERLRRGGLEGVYATVALGVGEAMPGLLKDDGSNREEIWALAAFVQSINMFER